MSGTQDAPQALGPGSVLQFTFPDLPETLHAKRREKPFVPVLTARLPENYDPGRSFPLLVLINGGTGGEGDNLKLVEKCTGNRDFIGVTMPLFKRVFDPEEIHHGMLVSADDVPVLASCWEKMLSKLYSVLPNVDFENSLFGGFSNGAHATAFLLSAQEPVVLEHFRHHFLLEGGLYLSGLHKRSMKDRRFLLMVGTEGKEPFRGVMLGRSELLFRSAERFGVDMTRVVMEGAGHEMPDRYVPVLRDWIYRVSGVQREV